MADEELSTESLAEGAVGSPHSSFVIVEWTDPGGGSDPPRYIAPLHLHHEDDEAWYVLEGRLLVRMGERDVELGAGGAALVPRGTPHTYWNPDPAPTRYLLIMTPRIKRLVDAMHDPSFDSGAMAEVFREHASEFLGWP